MSTVTAGSYTLAQERDPQALTGLEEEWTSLAWRAGTPFLTLEWLNAWWRAFGEAEPLCLLLRAGDGSLRAAAWCSRPRRGILRAAANVHSGDWDVVAADAGARTALWRELARLPVRRLDLPALRDDPASAGAAWQVLQAEGYRLVRERGPLSPHLTLPSTWDDLLASASRNLRSQLGRRRRALEGQGELRLRTVSAESQVDGELDTVFRVEAASWKRRSKTAILSDARTEALYREFGRAAAARGWLRLHVLELSGVPIAVEYGCVFGGGAFLIKTGFDERYARFSPGLVLRGEVLHGAIQEGLDFYDFLGGPDGYKLRWTNELRARATVRAYRGPGGLPAFVYRSRVRPALKAARDRWSA